MPYNDEMLMINKQLIQERRRLLHAQLLILDYQEREIDTALSSITSQEVEIDNSRAGD